MYINDKAKKVISILEKSSTPTNTSAVALSVGLPRTTVEYILRTLEKNRIVSSKKSGKATVWNTLPQQQKEESQTHVVHGIHNIIHTLELAVNKKDLDVIVIENDTNVSILARKKYSDLFINLNKKFQSKNCPVYVLFHKKTLQRMSDLIEHKAASAESLMAIMNRAMSAYILPDHLFNMNVHVAAIGDTVFFTDFEVEKSTVIRNKNLALFFKDLFTLVSRMETKVDIRDVVKKLLGV